MKSKSRTKKIENIFSLKYGDSRTDEIIAKSNELFAGTAAEILVKKTGEVAAHMLNTAGMTTAISKDSHLQSYDLFPITPYESELALKENKFNPRETWEDLALILYDTNGANQKEAQALRESIKNYYKELGLSKSDLKERLLIVNAGLEKDSSMPYSVKPIILPGLTEAYVHPVLNKTGKNYNFEYGLENGLPSVNELGKGSRTLYMPSEKENIGLRVLYRDGGLCLFARNEFLAYSYSGGRVSFVRRASQKISVPNIEEVIKYSNQFIPELLKEKFEKGFRKRFK